MSWTREDVADAVVRINATLDRSEYRLPIHQDPVSIQVTMANLDVLSTLVGQRITTLTAWCNDLKDSYSDANDEIIRNAEGSNKEQRDAWVRSQLKGIQVPLSRAQAWLEVYEKTLKIVERRINLAMLQAGAVRASAYLA